MAIDPAQAVGAEIKGGSFSWEPDQVILYHLGLGAGVPPTDPGELEYTFEKNLKVLPSYGVIPGGSMTPKLLTVPGMKFNVAMLLHGEHDLELPAPLPTQATVTNTLRVKQIYDKGKAALVICETEANDEAGNTVLINRSSLFIRGEGGWGGDPGPKPANAAPGREPDQVVETPTLPQQALLYRLSGDKNPLHADPEFAKLGGFERPILHGLCTYGTVCKAVVDHALGGDTAAVARYQVRFAGVVFPGETLVTSLWREDNKILLNTIVKERNAPALTNAAITLRG
ncbi:MAG: MaoC/PaaZ C-terminal domain-containing protein [bacterium]